MIFQDIPLEIQLLALSFCRDKDKRTIGQACKKMHELVFGDLIDTKKTPTHTASIWKNKIEVLKKRKSWLVKQNPKNVRELFDHLNILTY